MKTALDAPVHHLDEKERDFTNNIRKHGWTAMHVFGDEERPGFSYTTEFQCNLDQPEIMTFAMKQDNAQDFFWSAWHFLKNGGELLPAHFTRDLSEQGRMALFTVAKRHYAEHLGWSRWFYAGDNFGCIQLVWPDRNDVFPWQKGFDAAFAGLQPDLSENGWAVEIGED